MRIMPLRCYRPPATLLDSVEARKTVQRILAGVRARGDAALREFSRKYDQAQPRSFRVPDGDIRAAVWNCPPVLRRSIALATANLRRFARRQKGQYRDFRLRIRAGVTTGQRVLPIQRVGVYVPGGRYPLFSSLLMAAVPAQVAGVPQVAVFSPPGEDGQVALPILAAAGLLGLDEVYALGGAQAVAAMAFGSECVPAVDKIVGPGNAFVTLAKLAVFGQVGIDVPAGPSEIVILADDSARPDVIAADLLAQAEHDPRAIALLVTTSKRLAGRVQGQVDQQLRRLPASSPARVSMKRQGAVLLAASLEQAIAFINERAPEHLELQVAAARRLAGSFTAYGSLFIGPRAAEALGDYSSGLNHVLPTAGAARFCAGLSVRDFLRLATTLEVSGKGLQTIGPVAQCLAAAENLSAHARSLELRMADDSCQR